MLLPEYAHNPFISQLPKEMSMKEAMRFLSDPPAFKPEERQFPAHIRMQCLYRLRRCFIPLEHHLRLESAFSTMLRQGYVTRDPLTTNYIRRLRDGFERIVARDLKAGVNPVRSSAEGFALLGASGGGKTTGMTRVLEYYPQLIEHPELCALKQVVWLKIDCPYAGSPKQLCINFFRQMDLLLGTDFLKRHGNTAIDLMMTQMAQIANRHALGVLIVDELQHLTLAKGVGREALLNFLVTLINTIGIPVVLIGTMGALRILQGDFRQARRANGLGAAIWERLPQGPVWEYFLNELWPYQWTREESKLTDDVKKVLYEESQGIIDVVVKLFMLGQARAMELGATRKKRPETIDAALLTTVAKDHFKIIAPMIAALKSGRRSKIAQYDDLRPLDDHVQEALQAAQIHLQSQHSPAQAQTSPAASVEMSTEVLVTKLMEFELSEDIARPIATEALAEHPEASLLELIGMISSKLFQRAPEAKPSPRSRGTKAQCKSKTVSELEKSVSVDHQAGKSAHDSLRNAGLVSIPELDFEG
jgi:hypothetical protein